MITCKGCGVQIQFGVHETTGKRIPIDTHAVDEGNIVWLDNGRTVHVLTADEKITDRRPRYLSHFVTCPDRAEFRRRKGASR